MTAGVVRGQDAVIPALQEALTLAAHAPAQWLEAHGQLLKSEKLGVVGLIDVAGVSCYIKFFLARSAVQSLGFVLGLGRAPRAYDAGCELAARGIPVAEPLACLRLPQAMVLVTKAVPGADLKTLWLSARQGQDWSLIMSRTAVVLAQLHAAGFVHGDCKWGNLLWDGEGLVLVDLDSVRQSASPQRRGRDLARFVLNAEELALDAEIFETFVSVYAENSGSEKAAVIKLLAPSLAQLRQRHADKYGRRGARLLGNEQL